MPKDKKASNRELDPRVADVIADLPQQISAHIVDDRTVLEAGQPIASEFVLDAPPRVLNVPPLVTAPASAGPLMPQDGPPVAPHIWVNGSWRINQKNGYHVKLSVNQEGTSISAYCTHSNGSVRSVAATGHVKGEHFELTITWDNGTKGEYTGDLVPGFFTRDNEGILKGTTKDLNHSGSVSGWESDRTFARP